MSLAFLLLKDKTNSIVTNSVVFNAPGIYYPPYGKAVFQITGQGSPGNATVPGNVSGNNAYTTTTPVPASGGNVAAYYPATGGNYAGTNAYSNSTYVPAVNPSLDGGTNTYSYSTYVPASGGNYAGDNPAIPGNYAGTNPPTPGNFTGVNPATPGNLDAYMWNSTIYYSEVTNPGYSPQLGYQAGSSNAHTNYGQGGTSGVYSPPAPYSGTLGPSYYSIPGQSYTVYYTVTYAYAYPAYNPTTPGNATYNPPTPGNAYYNPTTPASPYYNPYSPAYTYNTDVPGNPNYNPYVPAYTYTTPVPGNPNYNPAVPAYSNYNPYVPAYTYTTPVPGNPNYNPTVSGTAGTNYTVLGVPFPGGAADSAAPVIGLTTIGIDYTNAGTPISVPPGGYITINTKPKTAP
jgi:hypothetical protein